MTPPPTITKQTVLTGFTTPTDTTNVLKQLRAAAALAAKKQQEAEEASRRAAEDLQRGEEEAKAKAEEEEESRRRAAEKKLAEMDKKKTGTERARRCTGCTKTKFDTPCTFSATSSSITSCDRCRRLKIACTFTGEAEKSRRKKRMVDEVESPRRGKGKKKSRHQSLSPSPMEIEEEADEMTPAVAAMQMMADKIGQLTELVCQVNNAMTEEFAAHRKELHRMVTALDHLLEYRDELVTTESIKQE